MQIKTLGRAAAAASLIILLVPGIASASWWDGDYDGRYDKDYSGRRNSTTTTTERRNKPERDRRDYGPPKKEHAPAPCGQPSPCEAPPPCEQASPCGAPPPPPPPPPPAAAFGPIYGCENSDLPHTDRLLHKTTTPPPGTPVRPGDPIFVEITWRPVDFAGPELHKVIDCVYINGLLVPGLSGGERFTPNDGHFAWHYLVPLDAPPGSEVCDQGFASGPDGRDEYGRRGVSELVCFPVALPPPPAPPCCAAPPPPPCCAAPPPVATTTTTTTTVPVEQPKPYAQPLRVDQQVPPVKAVPIVQPRDVLPQTGSGPAAARLAAGSLALAALIRRRNHRRS